MDRKIVSRLLAPLAAVSLLLLVTAIGSAWYTRSAQRRVSEMLTNNVASVRAAQELVNSVRDVDARLDRYIITGDRTHLDAIGPLRDRTMVALLEAESLAFTRGEQRLMAKVRQGCVTLFDGCDRAFGQKSREISRREIDELSGIPEREILGPAHEYARLNEEMLARSGRTNENLTGFLTTGFLVIGLCGAVGGLLGGWVIATGVRKSMERTENRLRGTAVRLSAVVPAGNPDRDALECVDESVSALLERFRQIERDALRAEQLAWVGQMAAGIAHEVRNPLMAIKILVQTAADPTRETPFRPKDLSVIEREIIKLEHVVAGFLDFARPPRPDKQPLDLGPLLEEVVAGLQGRADRQRVSFAVEFPTGPVTVPADTNQFRQVVYNLLYNALDAQPRGGRIFVSAESTSCFGEQELLMRVEDEGSGLPSSLGERIFEPFVSTKETGLGLGLSICRRIVEAHGGQIRGEPRATGGAVFTVRLPNSSICGSGSTASAAQV